MDNKVIDINEWVQWVLEKHPSQNQITTIKNFWKCNTLDDYKKYFKKDIENSRRFWWKGLLKETTLYTSAWCEHKYCWELDRLFDIYKYEKNCPKLSEVNIGYFVIKETIDSEKWEPYRQIIATYDKPDIENIGPSGNNNKPNTYRIIKYDLGVFKIYARQTLTLYNKEKHTNIRDVNSTDIEKYQKQGYDIFWDEEQVMFISIPTMKFNKSLLKGKVSLQSKKRLYTFSDIKSWNMNVNRYRLPELYYPTNIKEFIKYCCAKGLLDFAPSSIALWCKSDTSFEWDESTAKKRGSWYTPDYCTECSPFPMRNIKTEKELDDYIQERKEKRAIEISEKLSQHATAVYNKDVLFPLITSITQQTCDDFVNDYNNRTLYEICE